jgi:hypothetical protein
MVLTTLTKILEFIDSYCITSDRLEILHVMRQIIIDISTGVVMVGKHILKYLNGVLSGWRWTALIDTLVNSGELNAVSDYVKEQLDIEPKVGLDVEQGDDIRLLTINYSAAVMIWYAYTKAKFNVNPSKFFISDKVDEFLRQVTDGYSIHGYPARACTALVWRNPVSRELLNGEERIREACGSWNQFFNRQKFRSDKIMVRDLAGANKISQDQVQSLLDSPACVGGLGYSISFEKDWSGIEKGRVSFNYHFEKIPPLAVTLGKQYSIDPKIIEALWLPNVEPPAGTTPDYRPGRIYQRKLFVPLKYNKPQVSSVNMRFCIFRSDIPSSVVTVIKEQAIMTKNWVVLRDIVALHYKDIFDIIFKKFTRRVFIDWVLDRLPFATPIKPGWSSAATALLHSKCANAMWNRLLTEGHRVSMTRVERAALTAELMLIDVEKEQDILMGG